MRGSMLLFKIFFPALLLALSLAVFIPDSRADPEKVKVILKNGDRITGELIALDQGEVSLSTDYMGNVRISMEDVEDIIHDHTRLADVPSPERESESPDEVIWKREISMGLDMARGNTENTEVTGGFLLNRNHVHNNEITLKGDLFYSESDKRIKARKWYTLARYAYSFTASRKWYHFYRVETDHNRFSGIYYRVLPATGVGYWFIESPRTKLSAEASLGWEHTNYTGEKKSTDEVVLVPRVFFEKEIFDNTTILGNLYYYPAIDDFEDYRIRTELSLTTALNDKLSLRVGMLNEYDSAPPREDVKNNDLRFTSAIVLTL